MLILLPLTVLSFVVQFRMQFNSNSTSSESKDRLIISDTIINHQTVSSLANEEIIINRYFSYSEDSKNAGDRSQEIYEAFTNAFIYSLAVSSQTLYTYILFQMVAANIEDGKNTKHQFVVIYAYIFSSIPLSIAMINCPDFGKSKKAANNVLKYENLPHEQELAEIAGGVYEEKVMTSEIASQSIEFRNIWFRYPNTNSDAWVLRDFSLKIEPGQSIGLIGESGCGKSTVTSLLYRFYEPQRGRIIIGGYDITNFSLKSLRSNLGIVQQEPQLFNMTILDNIRYGKQFVTADEVINAAKIANCEEIISLKGLENNNLNQNEEPMDELYDQLDNGYRFVCGPKGSKLSGGQKQRVAIARTIITSPKILLLDEATSSLDEISQNEVQKALDIISKSCTSITIAHRRSALKNCDRIIEIVKGQIVS